MIELAIGQDEKKGPSTRSPRGPAEGSSRMLGAWFMLPAAAFLVLFLAYPLVSCLALLYGRRLAAPGEFIGTEN